MSSNEQITIILHYVDDGKVIEHFVGIEHVTNTNAGTLKEVIDDFFFLDIDYAFLDYGIKDMMEQVICMVS